MNGEIRKSAYDAIYPRGDDGTIYGRVPDEVSEMTDRFDEDDEWDDGVENEFLTAYFQLRKIGFVRVKTDRFKTYSMALVRKKGYTILLSYDPFYFTWLFALLKADYEGRIATHYVVFGVDSYSDLKTVFSKRKGLLNINRKDLAAAFSSLSDDELKKIKKNPKYRDFFPTYY